MQFVLVLALLFVPAFFHLFLIEFTDFIIFTILEIPQFISSITLSDVWYVMEGIGFIILINILMIIIPWIILKIIEIREDN
jgi:hypothetical protein